MEILRTENPFNLFQIWLKEATETEINDPEAMSLATVNAQGRPSVRMVLLKDVSEAGFTFYTNMDSRKGCELADQPFAALCFHWKSRRQQVRIEGKVRPVSAALADAYFQTRHPLSRLGAWASKQSQPLADRATLEARVAEVRQKYSGEDIPRPPYWGGYCLIPDAIEFWQDGAGRLHDRFLFTRLGLSEWNLTRLYP